MKIIDKDLKLFGIVHIVDILAVVLVFFVIFSVFFVVPKKPTLVNEDRTNSQSNTSDTWLEVYVRVYSMIPELVVLIKEGDKDVAPNGMVAAKVDKIISMEDSQFDPNRGVKLKRGVIKFLVRVFMADGSYFAETQELKIGRKFRFNALYYNLANDSQFEIIGFGQTFKGLKNE